MKWVVALVLAMVLTGCLGNREDGAGLGSVSRTDANTLYYGVGEVGGAGKRLIPYTTLAGYLHSSGKGPGMVSQVLTGAGARHALVRDPIAVGAGEHGVYIIDGESQSLYRFRWQIEDHADPKHLVEDHNGLTHPDFKRLRILSELDEPNDLFVSPSGDLFISDGKAGRVVQYDKDGVLLREYRDKENLNRPVAVTVDSRGLRIFVADSLYDRVVVFNSQGESLYGIGFRGDAPGGFKNIRTMVQGRNGILYVVNGVRQQIQAYGVDGTYVGSFGQGTFTDPEGLAVDDDNRLFLADRFNHRLMVFRDGKLVETYGRYGSKAGDFSQPGRLAYYKGYLYVADRRNARIQVFKVVPEEFLKNAGGDSK